MKEFVVETSARHVHVTEKDLAILYGEGYKLNVKKELSQPQQFCAEEKVTVVGPKGELKMSILGPTRKETQVEISLTDARSIGIQAPIKESGDLFDAAPCKIVGPKGEITCDHAVIVAKRHIHATKKDAEELGVTNGEIVKVEVDSNFGRKLIFDDVVCRVSDSYALAMHIDTDESNAAYGCSNGHIIK